jgi:hypothetical protein
MNSRFFALLGAGVAGALLWSCTEDPTATLKGGLDHLALEYGYREVIIADSVRTFAVETDAGGTVLPPTATVTSCNAAIATVIPTSDAPLLRRAFYVKGIAFGSTCIVASAGNLRDTMRVSTFPSSIVVSGGPDTLLSGSTGTYGYTYRDARQTALAGLPQPSFSSNDTLRGKPQATPLGSVLALSPGVFTLTVTGAGSPTGGITGTKIILVEPGPFLGGVSPTSGDPGDTVSLTNAVGGPGFDANTEAFFRGVRTFTFGVTPNAMQVVVPGVGTAGSVDLLMTQMGPANLAQRAPFTSNTASFADPYDGVNDDPLTAPPIGNGDFFIVVSGACVDGAGGPGTDCDDFFTLTNALARPDTITVRLDWFTAADVDILYLNAAGTGFVGNFAGATGANPEVSTVVIPASTTWRLLLNLWAPGGASSSVARVRVSGQG